LKWLKVIKKLVSGYNATKHSALVNGKYSPNQVTNDNASEIEQYRKGPAMKRYPKLNTRSMVQQFNVGDLVAVSTNRRVFEKGRQY